MDKDKLQKAYEAVEMLKALDLPVSKEQMEQITQLEASYLQENIIPLLEKHLEPMVKDMVGDFRIEILYSKQEGLTIKCGEKPIVKPRKQAPEKPRPNEAAINRSKKRYIIKVTFSDGFSICYNNVVQTFIEVIERIGAEKVMSINEEAFRGTLVIENADVAAEMQYKGLKVKQLSNGSYINVNTNTMAKMRQLQIINDTLHLGLKIEKIGL